MEYNGINFQKNGDHLTVDIINALGFGAKLPHDYMNFLLAVNGGVPNKNVFEFVTIDKKINHEEISFFRGITSKSSNIIDGMKYRGNIIPERMLVIADALEANMILMSLKNPDRGRIYHWDSRFESDISDLENVGSDNLILVADNFDEFLSKLYFEDEIDTSKYK